MLRTTLDTPFFYFSYTYDLTHTLQRLHSMPPEFLQMGLLERAEPRFVWNRSLLQGLQQLKKYCLPLVHGCKRNVEVFIFYFNWLLILQL